jgi:hypothetical protein
MKKPAGKRALSREVSYHLYNNCAIIKMINDFVWRISHLSGKFIKRGN